jgi:mercuric ion transport protein
VTSVEFIYDKDCPNVAAARANLIQAFVEARIVAKWSEWERSSPDTPAYAREFGSPAILVNGHDIAGLSPNPRASCRIYSSEKGNSLGVPPVELIADALRSSLPVSARSTGVPEFKKHLPIIPAVLFALLPKVACPACWPAYVGLLSAVGLGFLVEAEFLLPLIVIFLAVALVALAYGARKRRGFGPLFLGMIASAAIMLGKFSLNSDFAFYTGLALLVGSSLWNTWPRKQSKTASCCECAPAGIRCEK